MVEQEKNTQKKQKRMMTGQTDFPNTPDKDPLVLVLKKAAASYSGTIAVGAAKPQALENFQIEDEDTFSFEFSISTGDDTTKVKAKLDVIDDKIDGNKLMGAWNMESGDYGSIELIRQK